MPNGVSNVSLTAPNDYQLELADIERRKALAQALQQQGMQPSGGTEMVGGWAIPKSPMEGLGKAAQQVAGGYQQRQLLEEERGIGRKYQSDLADTLMRAQQAGVGTPGMPEQSRQGPLNDDEGNAMPGVAAQAAVAPDRARMAQILMGHPATQAMGAQQFMQDTQRQALVDAIRKSGQPQGAPASPQAAQPGQPASGGAQAPQSVQAFIGGPAGGVPMEMWLQNDPNAGYQNYIQQLAKDHQQQTAPINVRPGGTVYVPGQGPQFTAPMGGAQTNWQNGQPQVSAVPGAATVAGQQAQAVAAGTQAGQAPYQPGVVQTEGAPTLMTREQQIQAATGQPMPQPGQQPAPMGSVATNAGMQNAVSGLPINPPGEPPMGASPQNLDAQGRPIPDRRKAMSGLRLQDQGEGAEQKKFGEETAQLRISAPIDRAAVAESSAGLLRMKELAAKISSSPALGRITGLIGALPNIPGSAAADVDALLKSLKAQVGFGALQSMRDASKTGGALGNVSDKENELLQNKIAALDKAQSPEAMRLALGDLISFADGSIERLQRAYSDKYERVIGNQGMAPSSRGAAPIAPAASPGAPAQTRVVKWGEL